MKICSPQLGLDPKSYLGGEVYDHQIIKYLASHRNKIYILLPKKRIYEKNKNIKAQHLPIKTIFPPHIFNIFAMQYILKTYKKNKFEVLRVHNPYFLGFSAWLFKKINPQAKVVTDILLEENRFDLDQIIKATKNCYDHFFVLTNYLESWLIKKYKIPKEKITVIYGGVDKEIFSEKKNNNLVRKYSLKRKIVLLNIGLFIDRKGVLFLIEVFNKLQKKNKNLVLFFCGSGPLKKDMTSKIKQYQLDEKIFILNPVSGKDKRNMFNLADIFLFPTKSEGFGLVAAEAMMCAKPVVASNNTSIPEVVKDGETGFLAKTTDLGDWCNKTERLIENPGLRARLGKKGKRRAEKIFTWNSVGLKINTKLKNL